MGFVLDLDVCVAFFSCFERIVNYLSSIIQRWFSKIG